jgi:hypothetical protein
MMPEDLPPLIQPLGLTEPHSGTIAYADRHTPGLRTGRFDYAVLALTSIQTGLAGLACIAVLQSIGRGFYESNAPTMMSAAWRLADFDFHSWVWLVISLLLLIGAMQVEGPRRWWYRTALSVICAELIIGLAAMYVLSNARFSYRWISAHMGTTSSIWVAFNWDSDIIWQGPMFLVIFNPACLLLIVRWIRSHLTSSAASES